MTNGYSSDPCQGCRHNVPSSRGMGEACWRCQDPGDRRAFAEWLARLDVLDAEAQNRDGTGIPFDVKGAE